MVSHELLMSFFESIILLNFSKDSLTNYQAMNDSLVFYSLEKL